MYEIECCICETFEIVNDHRMRKWVTHKCDKKNCTGYLCANCYQKYDPRSQNNARKSVAHIRNSQLYKYVSSGRGIIGEAVIAKVRRLEIISVISDNFNSRHDLSRDIEYGIIQSKIKIPWYGDWYVHFGKDHHFDTLFFQCVSRDMKDIKRAYAIPESELFNIKSVSIYNNPCRKSKWEKFRIDEKHYNDAYHNLMSYLNNKKYFGVEDIKKWLCDN